MQDFEKLGAFYLGRPFDLNEKKPKEGLLLYDSKDLVTHAVCVGMTGSGKTGSAEDNVTAVMEKLAVLEEEFKAETAALERSLDPQTEELEKVSLKPTKSNIAVKLVTLAWAPYWHDANGAIKPAWE